MDMAMIDLVKKQQMNIKTHPKEYHAWRAARQRCNNPNNREYKRYGARGIKMSPLWNTFKQFIADMGIAPSPEHELDRIDNDGDYEPGNCRWATHDTQVRNRRQNVYVNFNGVEMCIKDVIKKLPVSEVSFYAKR
jgi:hypothetical protein